MHFAPLRQRLQRLQRGRVEPFIRSARIRFWGMIGLALTWVLVCLRSSEQFFGTQAVYDELILGAKSGSADVDFGFGGDYIGWGELADEPYFPDFNFDILDAAWEAMNALNESMFSPWNSSVPPEGLPQLRTRITKTDVDYSEVVTLVGTEEVEDARRRFFWERRPARAPQEGRRARGKRQKQIVVPQIPTKGRRWGWLTRFFHRPAGIKASLEAAPGHGETTTATAPCSPTRADANLRSTTLKTLREELEAMPGLPGKAASAGLEFTDEALARYLEMTDWHLHSGQASVADMVAHTVQWRLDHGVDTQPRPEFPTLAEGGIIYVNGRDAQGRPVVIYTPTTDTGTPIEQGLSLLVYNLERAISEAEAVGLSQYVFIVDLAKVGPVPPLKTVKAAFEIMGRHYPGRVNRIFLVHGGSTFYWLWKFLEPVIPERTRARVSILTADEEEQVLTAAIPAAHLERRFKGGLSEYVFNSAKYFGVPARTPPSLPSSSSPSPPSSFSSSSAPSPPHSTASMLASSRTMASSFPTISPVGTPGSSLSTSGGLTAYGEQTKSGAVPPVGQVGGVGDGAETCLAPGSAGRPKIQGTGCDGELEGKHPLDPAATGTEATATGQPDPQSAAIGDRHQHCQEQGCRDDQDQAPCKLGRVRAKRETRGDAEGAEKVSAAEAAGVGPVGQMAESPVRSSGRGKANTRRTRGQEDETTQAELERPRQRTNVVEDDDVPRHCDEGGGRRRGL